MALFLVRAGIEELAPESIAVAILQGAPQGGPMMGRTISSS